MLAVHFSSPFVIALLVLAGCTSQTAPPDATEGQAADNGLEWVTGDSELAVSFNFTSKTEAQCTLHLRLRGIAPSYGAVAGFVIDRPVPDVASREPEGPTVTTLRIADDATSGQSVYVQGVELHNDAPATPAAWWWNMTHTFISSGSGQIFVVAMGLDHHQEENPPFDPEDQSTGAIKFSCAGTSHATSPRPHSSALVISGPIADGVGSIRFGSLAHMGLANDLSWNASVGSGFFGNVNGFPTKAWIIALVHPSGREEWRALPTSALAVAGVSTIGDSRFGHASGPGKYQLELSGFSAPELLEAVVFVD